MGGCRPPTHCHEIIIRRNVSSPRIYLGKDKTGSRLYCGLSIRRAWPGHTQPLNPSAQLACLGKAAEGRRTPRHWRDHQSSRVREASWSAPSPLALFPVPP